MKIYEPTGKAREYSPLALNYFKGCDHGCKYCYVPNFLGCYNKSYNHKVVSCNQDFIELKRSAQKMQGCNTQILLSFTGDPYCNYETTETSQVLEILNYYKHKVAILTKNPEKAFKDVELIKQFGNRIKVGTTLTFNNEEDSKEWEPGAPTSESRLKGLKQFVGQGVMTWASFEPVIDTNQSLMLLKQCVKYVNHVKIGKLNNYENIEKKINWYSFLKAAVGICREAELPFYIKKCLSALKQDIYLSENEIEQDYLNL